MIIIERSGYYIILLYIYSLCIASGFAFMDTFYENVVNAQETLKEVASSVELGLKTLGQTVKFLDKFIDSTLEEDCVYTCKKKKEVLVGRPSYIPKNNGCGSLGLHLEGKDLPRPEMEECCNEHDRCYDTCGSDKEDCDKKFKRCLYRICDDNKDRLKTLQHKFCQGGAKLLYTTTLTLGCTSYKEAQAKACVCKPLVESEEKFKNYQKEL